MSMICIAEERLEPILRIASEYHSRVMFKDASMAASAKKREFEGSIEEVLGPNAEFTPDELILLYKASGYSPEDEE